MTKKHKHHNIIVPPAQENPLFSPIFISIGPTWYSRVITIVKAIIPANAAPISGKNDGCVGISNQNLTP